MKYFTIDKLTTTLTGLPNVPNAYQILNLNNLVDHVLDPLRELWGKPIYVSSAFRSTAVNVAAGGKPGSQHLTGQAADITCSDNQKLFELIRDNLPFDQLIDENNLGWVHVSYTNLAGRRQVLYLTDGKQEHIKKVNQEKQQQIEDVKDIRPIRYVVTEDTTVDEFLKNNISFLPKMTKTDFLKYKPKKSTNADQIYWKYSPEDRQNSTIKTKYSKFNLDVIKANTLVFFPVSEYQEELCVIGGSNVFMDQNKTMPAYFIEEDTKLKRDSKYVKLEKLYSEGDIDVQTIEENCQVWIYVKSIDKLIDVSPFVNSLAISKSDIGQFSIDLSPIQIDVDRATNSINAVFVSFTNGKEYLNDYEVKTFDDKLNVSFFEKYCQQNDAVFIRFEKLQLEEDKTVTKTGSHLIEVSKQSIPNQIFDMIGLVDTVGSNVNLESNDYSVSISGRDLMKVLVEDGAYLIELTFAKGAENMFFFLGDSQDKYFKRVFVTNGGFEYLWKNYFDPLKDFMGFIVNQLSSVGWTGDNDLFNYYPKDKLAKKSNIDIRNGDKYLENIELNGIWKICHIKVDPALKDRRVVDSSFVDTDGTLYEQFKKVCQTPLVEFWGDTYGSNFNFIARQQPFDLNGMLDVANDTSGVVIDIENRDVFQTNLQWEDEFYSWIQFTPNGQAYNNDPQWLATAFPVIYFDSYVENFGNHRYEAQDNYVAGRSVDGLNGEMNKQNVAIGLFNDLKYIIETVSVLPFTRKGSLVINGDRRIKKGSFVRLKATEEIFYVESVANSISFSSNSVNRTTVLSVKRGMKEKFIVGDVTLVSNKKGKEDQIINPSYFNIVNSDMIVQTLIERFSYTEGISKTLKDVGKVTAKVTKSSKHVKVDFGVNPDQFNFFLKRRQMDDIYDNYKSVPEVTVIGKKK
jgi:hypothetical protein